jgi:hypothetical protein
MPRDGSGARQHFRHRARRPGTRRQRDFGLRRRRRGFDGRDDGVDVGECDGETFQDVPAFARLAQLEQRAASDDFAPMAQEGVEHFLQAEQPRLSIDQRDHVDAEHLLHLGLGIQIVQQNLGYFAALQLDHDAHAVLVGFVAQAV